MSEQSVKCTMNMTKNGVAKRKCWNMHNKLSGDQKKEIVRI